MTTPSIAPTSPDATLAYLDRVERDGVEVTNALPETFGEAPMLRQSPAAKQWEDLAAHIHLDRHIGHTDGAAITVDVVSDNRPVKCNAKRAETSVNLATGNYVATIRIKSYWYHLELDKLFRNFFHEVAHGRGALAQLNGAPKDINANGAHSKTGFRSIAEDYFTEDSFITAAEVTESNGELSQTDVHTIREDGWEFQPWVSERIESFGFDTSLLKVASTPPASTPRTGTKTVTVGCVEHHWELDAEDRTTYWSRIDEHSPEPPLCGNSEHRVGITKTNASEKLELAVMVAKPAND